MSLSMLPSIRAPASSRRPKLSIQTSSISSLNNKVATDSPTNLNTLVNAFLPSPQQSSPYRPRSRPHPSSSRENSPPAPYCLPIGARSILRNSPLPPRHVSATSVRTPRRMFPLVKRVAFRENLVEIMPTPLIDGSDSSSDSDSSTSSRKRRMSLIAEDDRERARKAQGHGPPTPVQGRSKRGRDWVWTLDESHSGYRCSSPDAGKILRQGAKSAPESQSFSPETEEELKLEDNEPRSPPSLSENRLNLDEEFTILPASTGLSTALCPTDI